MSAEIIDFEAFQLRRELELLDQVASCVLVLPADETPADEEDIEDDLPF